MTDDAFVAASRVLTGIDALPEYLARTYRERAEATCGASGVAELVAIAPEHLLASVEQDPALRAVAEQVAVLWYASATFNEQGELSFGSSREHFASRLWPTIGAHPPGLSGGYMGHWRYPPEWAA